MNNIIKKVGCVGLLMMLTSYLWAQYCVPQYSLHSQFTSSFVTTGCSQDVAYNTMASPSNSYADSTAMIIEQNRSYYVNFTHTYSHGQNSGIRIWVDWDDDGVFSKDELVYGEIKTDGTPIEGGFLIPLDAPLGEHRMRVRSAWTNNPAFVQPPQTDASLFNACDVLARGSAVDYTLRVTVPPGCIPIKNLTVQTTGNAWGYITWQSQNATPETEWEVAWGQVGFTPGDNNQIGNFIVNNGADTVITGLNGVGNFEVYVRAKCSSTSTSEWISTIYNNPYCTPEGFTTSSDYYIASATTTGATLDLNYTTSTPQPYVDATATHVVVAEQNSSFDLTLHQNTSSARWGIWIDFNKNGLFSDVDEHIYEPSNYVTDPSIAVTIPSNMPQGSYRVRVANNYLGYVADPCGSSTYGGFVDFTLVVVAPGTNVCLPIKNLVANTVTHNSVNLSWESNNTTPETQWEVAWGTPVYYPINGVSGFVGSEIVNGTLSAVINDLIPETDYKIYVRAVCDSDQSIWIPISITTDPTCKPVAGIEMSNLEKTQVDVAWDTQNIIPETEWNVSWGIEGYTPGSNDDIANIFVSNGADTTINGIAFNNSYEVYVRAVCSPGDTSVWTKQFFDTKYCTLTYTYGCNNGSKIKNIVSTGAVVDLENETGDQSCGANGYNDFTEKELKTIPGEVFNLEITVGSYDGWVKAWIDWNDNLIFEEDELILESDDIVLKNTSVSKSFTIPANASIGGYRMRVRVVEGTSNSEFTACSSQLYGEVEDYTLTVLDPDVCLQVKKITTSNITHNSVDIAWNTSNNIAETQWEVAWGTSGFVPNSDAQVGSFIVSNGADTTVHDLTPETAYDIYVRAICGVGDTSIWIHTSATTIPSCLKVKDIQLVNITSGTANIVWESTNTIPETQWHVVWGTPGFTIGTNDQIGAVTVSNGADTSLIDLPNDQAFDVYVRAICSATDTSYSEKLSVLASLCVPVYEFGCSNGSHITKVVTTGAIGNIENISDCSNGNYTNNPSLAIQVVNGNTVTMSVTVGAYSGAIKTWIDWNNNNQFEDNEIVMSSPTTISTGSTYTESFTVPDNATIGHHRVRIRVVENTTSFTACSSQNYGEYEEYTLKVLDPANCLPVENFVASNLFAHSIDLTWNAINNPAETQWQLSWGPPGYAPNDEDEIGNVIVSDGADTTITGATPVTTYQLYIRSICAAGDTSDLWIPLTVKTPPTCVTVKELKTTSVSSGIINIAWESDNVTPETEWKVVWGKSGFTLGDQNQVGSFIVSNGADTTITGLLPDGVYDIYVRANCSNTDSSAWTFINAIAGYCTPKGLLSSTIYYPTSITTENASVDVNYTSVGAQPNGYANETATHQILATQGSTFDLTIESTGSTSIYYYVGVDWNGDYVFGDNDETLLATTVPGTNIHTQPITISATQPAGVYRMRVATSWIYQIPNACSNLNYGSFVDLMLVVVEPTNVCLPVHNILASNITHNSGDIIWNTQNVTPETEWEIVWGTPNFTIGTDGHDGQIGSFTVSNGADTTITNLAPVTIYEVYVRAVCSSTSKSLWMSRTFTTQPTCLPVTDILLTGITPPTANMVWSSQNITPETEWEVVWGTPNFTIGTDGQGGQIGSFTVSNGADTTLYALPVNGTCLAYVRAVCSSTDKSVWTPFNVTSSYCIPSSVCSNGAKIEHVKTNGAEINVDNVSGDGNICGIDGYNDFTNMEIIAVQGATVSMEVKVATYSGGVKAWIDWNNNNLFEDDEIVINSPTTVSAGTTYTESFIAPSILGTRRMRVRVVEGTTNFTACSYQFYSEVEDYTFSVIQPNECLYIKNLNVSNITATTFDIAWDAQNLTPETEWEVVWGTPNFTIGTDGQDGQVGSFTVSNGADTTIANLASSTTYEVFVRAVCSSTNKSAWRSISTTTLASCLPVNGIIITGVSDNEADIVWSSQNSTPETEWNVSWGPAGYTIGDGDEIGSETVSNGSDTTLYNLPEGNGYHVYVRAVCSSSDMSEWTLFNVSAQYCTPTYSNNCSNGARISKVAITNAIVNLEHQTGLSCNNYSNYTDKTVVVAKEATNVTVDVSLLGYSGYVKAWVDWNNNLSFEADELIFESASTISNGGSLTQSFDVPINAPLGTHRLRVRVVETPGNFTACGHYSYGEVEDYTLIIVDPATECTSVNNLTASNITSTSFDLSWEATNTTPETAWEVVWGTPGFTIGADGQDGQIGSFTVSNGADTTITGLTFGESYTAYVRAVCAVGDVSLWGSVNVTLKYCTPNVTYTSYYSAKFQTMGAVNNVNYTASSNVPNGYANLTATDTIKQVQGAYVQFKHKMYTGYEAVRIWIDWNNNLTFDDNEEVFFDYNSSASDTTYGEFYIPNSATPGAYRLRMRAVFVANNSDFEADACATYSYSTTLDYMLEVIECKVGAGQISGDTVLCLGLPGQLVSTETLGTASWSSSDPNKVTVTLEPSTNAGIITALATGQATLKYVLKAPNGCIDSTTVDVNVQAPYTVNITDSPSNDSLLKGTDYTYASDGVSGTWSSTNAFIASVDPTSGKVTALLAGGTDIVYTETHTCFITALKHLTVYENIDEGGGGPEPCPNPPCDINGIDEIDFVSNVSLFPNPATSTVNVEFDLLYVENVSVEIVDLNGKVMYTQFVPTAVVGTNVVELDLAKYANGVYSVIVRSNEALTTKKLVISK